MKSGISPHLIWSITVLIIVGMVLFFIKGVLVKGGERKEELIGVLADALEKNVKITVNVDVQEDGEQPANP